MEMVGGFCAIQLGSLESTKLLWLTNSSLYVQNAALLEAGALHEDSSSAANVSQMVFLSLACIVEYFAEIFWSV